MSSILYGSRGQWFRSFALTLEWMADARLGAWKWCTCSETTGKIDGALILLPFKNACLTVLEHNASSARDFQLPNASASQGFGAWHVGVQITHSVSHAPYSN